LLQERAWDLIVFARQINRIPQSYDSFLANLLCEGQKALITDLYFGVAAPNPVLECAGANLAQGSNWRQIIGDETLVSGNIALVNPGYTIFSQNLSPVTFGGPWKIQASNDNQGASIIGNGSACPAQSYFYSTMVNSFGRIEPFVGRPRVHVGHQLLATFRITESNRPVGNFDEVNATVTLRRPRVQPVEIYTLYDDGTNGDKLAGNHVWSFEIPQSATETGPYLFTAKFDMEKDGCTIHREAEYIIIVDYPPEICSPKLTCAETVSSYSGAVEEVEFACAVNLCSSQDNYQVRVEDSKGWLCTVDNNSMQIPIPDLEYQSDYVDAGRGICLFDHPIPLFICVPAGSSIGDFTVVTHTVTSLITGQIEVCETRVVVTLGIDCNENGQHDLVDIETGFSDDLNINGIPDECDCWQDLNGDGKSNLADFGIISNFWLNDCFWPDFCQGADNNGSGKTDVVDLERFIEKWLHPCEGHH
jgi:hypothetical protein